MDINRHAGTDAQFDQRFGSRQIRRQRLLANHRQPTLRGQPHELGMRIDVRNDVHHVDRLSLQEQLRIIVDRVDPELLSQHLRLPRVRL